MTKAEWTDAQKRVIGRFCSHCRQHRNAEGGREVKTKGPIRWFCARCAASYDEAAKRGR